jgi:hypothetical protein
VLFNVGRRFPRTLQCFDCAHPAMQSCARDASSLDDSRERADRHQWTTNMPELGRSSSNGAALHMHSSLFQLARRLQSLDFH